MRLAELAAFNSARTRSARRSASAGTCLFLGAAGVAASRDASGAATAMLAGLGAALLVLAAGCLSAGLLAQARDMALRAELVRPAPADVAEAGAVPADDRLSRRGRRRATWQQAAGGGVLAAMAVAAAVVACSVDRAWSAAPGTTAACAAALLALAFALLVLERHLAAADPLADPEAPGLAALVRVPLAAALCCGVGCLLLYAGIGAGSYAGRVSAILCLLVATEMTLRACATLFVPFPPITEARAVATSVLAAALGLPLGLHRPRRVAAAVRDLFGIDLSRSWAIAFVRAALAPVLAVLVLFGWALSGVEALRVDQRGVYERFGRPVAVFGPGLHLRLPWPAGRLRPIELGTLHDVPIVFDGADTGGASPARAPLPDVEGQPGPSADRLWDESHPSEAAYLVASLSRGQQSFQSVNIDLRVVYRIGLSDAAALAAAYASDDPRRLVQAMTSRLLAHYFAHHTLPGVLGADQAGFSREIAAGLQAELDAIPAGVQVMAVVVEAVHPPPGAASAYHAVQTAQISAHTAMAEQTGYAIGHTSDALRDSGLQRDAAAAASHEAVADATVHSTGFATDRAAYAIGPIPFLLERKLERLVAGLAHRQVLIVDHRLQGRGDSPFIDLRRGTGSSAADLPPPQPSP